MTSMDIDTFTSTETSVDEQAFLNWLTSNDSTVHPSIKLHDFGSMGRGLIATEDITVRSVLYGCTRPILIQFNPLIVRYYIILNS